MGSKTLILGGGVGGVVTANILRGLLPKEHEIVVIDKKTRFHLGASKTWVMLGHKTVSEITRPLEALQARGISVLQDEVQKIDAAAREVKTTRATIAADYLVIALGVDLNPGAIPGLDRAETFYTLDGAVRLGEILRQFKGGDIVILNPRTPIQCPPAPYEAAMLLDHEFKKLQLRDKTRISLYTVEPAPIPTAGPQISQIMRDELARRNIAYQTQKRLKTVDGERRVVSFEDGAEAPYDLLIAVPAHEAPRSVRQSGLTNQSGWIPVDPKTLQTAADRVYAIGDVTVVPLPGRYKPDVPLVLPKAAVFAEGHGRVVAAEIAGHVLEREPSEVFDGKGFCFIEMGDRHALGGEGAFFELPHPRVTPRGPDPTQFEEKEAWAAKFLEKYF